MKDFRSVPGYPKLWASRDGEILYENFAGFVREAKQSKLKGYRIVNYDSSEKRTSARVHRLVALAWVDGYSAGLEVNHLNGNKADNRAENLEWVTHLQNMRHATEVMGVIPYRGGAKNPRARLTENQVAEIRKLRAEGSTLWSVARRFDISATHVDYICKGKSWKN